MICPHFQTAENLFQRGQPKRVLTFFNKINHRQSSYKKGVGAPERKGSQGAKVFGRRGSGGGIKPSGLN